MNQETPSHISKKRFRLKHIKWVCLVGIVFLVCFAFYAPMFVYHRFNQAVPIAKLTFEQIDIHLYKAHLRTGDFCHTQTFLLTGDQWQLDASFLKFTGPAVLLGFESRYQLDRLSGRFQNITDQNTIKPDAYDLKEKVWIDFFNTKPSTESNAWLVDTTYGSSVYLTIQTDVNYTVYKTEDGLIAKGDPHILDLSDGNTITISNSCADTGSIIQKLGLFMNTLLLNTL